jgi:hypothetical protein
MKFSQFKFLAMAMSCMVIALCTGAQSVDKKFEGVESARSMTVRTVLQNEQGSSINDSLTSQENIKPVVKSTYWGNIYSAGGTVANSIYQMIDFSVKNPGKAFTIALAASIPVTAATTNLHREKLESLLTQHNCNTCACICSTNELREGMGANGIPYDASPQMGNTANWYKVVNIGGFSDQKSCGTACTAEGNHFKGCYTYNECSNFRKSDEFKQLLALMNKNSDTKSDNGKLKPCPVPND